MNWIERMYEIKGKDLYSQNGEGLLLEYVFHTIGNLSNCFVDIGGSDGFYLSNTKHISNLEGWYGHILDLEGRIFITAENVNDYLNEDKPIDLLSIDIDGNDYWVLDSILKEHKIPVIIAEFNPAFIDSRTIKYNPDHVWAGDDYYGFSFEAGKKLAEKHGYEIIFNVANMNLIMVRNDLIKVPVPPVTYQQVKFFKESNHTDWEWI